MRIPLGSARISSCTYNFVLLSLQEAFVLSNTSVTVLTVIFHIYVCTVHCSSAEWTAVGFVDNSRGLLSGHQSTHADISADNP